MKHSPELIAKIKMLHFHQHYTVHAVSKVVGLPDTINRVLYGSKFSKAQGQKAKMIAPYLDMLEKHLVQYPKITSTHLHRLLKAKGFPGSVDTVRRVVTKLRPQQHEIFVPQSYPSGFQGQVDWAHFGELELPGGPRKLYLFVLVLSWSRAVFAKFTFDQKTPSFLSLHEDAFEFFQGVPTQLLYDNLKSPVLERYSDYVRFNPDLLELSSHYGFDPQAAKPYRGNQKGRVERAIRYIREDFWISSKKDSILSLNDQMKAWLRNQCNRRAWPQDRQYSVCEQLEKERPVLSPLPRTRMHPKYRLAVRSNKCCLVRFDTNDYSIPWKYSRQLVTLEASNEYVSIYREGKPIAEHKRCWSKHKRILNKGHWKDYHQADRGKVDFLSLVYPNISQVFSELIKRGESYVSMQKQFTTLHDLYGPEVFVATMTVATKEGKYHPKEVASIISKMKRTKPERLQKEFQLDAELAQLEIKSQDLNTYDLF